MTADPNLIALARDASARHALDPALVCAIVEQESAWNAFAMRYEPGFRARYVAPLGLAPAEEVARSISWGLMQVMGQVAREHGFGGKFLSALCDPAAGLECGCRVLAAKIARAAHEFTPTGAFAGAPLESSGGIAAAPPAVSSSSGQGIAPQENKCASAEDDLRCADLRGEASGHGLSRAGLSAAWQRALAPEGIAGLTQDGAGAKNNSQPPRAREILTCALVLWNGGADPAYPEAVFARMSRYQ